MSYAIEVSPLNWVYVNDELGARFEQTVTQMMQAPPVAKPVIFAAYPLLSPLILRLVVNVQARDVSSLSVASAWLELLRGSGRDVRWEFATQIDPAYLVLVFGDRVVG